MQNIDEKTILQAAEGDMKAFERVYRLSAGYIYTLAFRVTCNIEDAQEVTQDVFLKIHKNLKRFNFRSSFKTWAYRIAVNTALNLVRKRKKEREKIVVFENPADLENIAEDRMTPIGREDTEEEVRGMLDALPPEQRACVVLRSIEGLEYKEIARVLDININTVRSRLKRAREKLLLWRREEEVQPDGL